MKYLDLPDRIREVFSQSARRYNVRPSELIGSGRRNQSISQARREVSKALRRMGKSYPEIARYMGVDHSSVICQVRGRKPAPVVEKPWEPDESGVWAI